MENMISDNNTSALVRLGQRLRAERLARNESQTRFAARLGVSIPTLRRLEQGDPSAQIGHWFAALDVLGRLADVETLLAPRYSLFDMAAQENSANAAKTGRQRARRRDANKYAKT